MSNKMRPSIYVPRPYFQCQRGSASILVFVGFSLVVLFFLLAEHRAHFIGWLPLLLLAACPLMHLFHSGHGRHGSHGNDGGQRKTNEEPPPGSS